MVEEGALSSSWTANTAISVFNSKLFTKFIANLVKKLGVVWMYTRCVIIKDINHLQERGLVASGFYPCW